MLLEINDMKKSHGGRTVVSLKRLALYAGDKLAVTGKNGAGKTTLLRLVTGDEQPDEGRVKLRARLGVVAQFDTPEDGGAHSGGERTAALIDSAFAQAPELLIADEPTTNLDIAGIERLSARLCAFGGALMLVSHDRALLREVCNKVLEIEDGACTLYGCGYDEYAAQKQRERAAQAARYGAYAAENKRLKAVAEEKTRQSARVKKTPPRMGNSEARLHKMGGQQQKAKLDKAAKAARSRIGQLERVEKPRREKQIVFDLRLAAIHSPVLVSVDGVSKSYGEKRVLDDCRFIVPNGKKTALVGANGAGKTTLLELIMARADGVQTCAGLRIGCFKQDMSTVDLSRSVLENVLAHAACGEQFARTILARLLFRRDAAHQKAGTLSGGERLKLALAGVILSGFHLLVLDEPTNYLDLESRQALETVLCAYPGAVLFVSHDRAFLTAVADRVVHVERARAKTFECGFEEYERRVRSMR